MGARSYELVWVATLLECLPQVDLDRITITAGPQWVVNAQTGELASVPGLTLAIQAETWAAAELLVEALSLSEGERKDRDDGYGIIAFRTWHGWVAEASHEAAVWVEVTAGQRMWEAVA
jgi:hypothetical protein